MDYQEMIKGVVSGIKKDEKVASECEKEEKVASENKEERRISAVEKAAYEIIESLEKVAEEETPVEVDTDINEEDIAEANEVYLKALHLEREAEAAYEESQIMKTAAVKVLCDSGVCSEKEAEALLQCTIDDIMPDGEEDSE